jgi:hypothetical protein
MALVKEIWIGPERGYCCTIDRAVFAEGEYGDREEARRACLRHACEIVKEQTRIGVPRNASTRERRRHYKQVPVVAQIGTP